LLIIANHGMILIMRCSYELAGQQQQGQKVFVNITLQLFVVYGV